MAGPLEAVRVLDLTTMVAGPVATRMLADQGADIIKIEPPSGDLMRHFSPLRNGMSASFLSCNRNKRSLAVDLKAAEGLEIVHKLIATADVLVHNFRPGAAESARFVMAYARIGLSPDGGTTYFLPRRIGIGRALELFYTNRTLSAREALEWGIANRVVPDSELAAEAHTLAIQLAVGPTKAFGAGKRLMHAGWHETLESQIEQELRSIGVMSRTEDAREAIAAFTAKRAPQFKGR
ncbi:MAG TPA: CoA transferase [Candidatus Binatia bacterium]|nr:CoA transferase [Candidatus Binatia bacterium]